MHVTALQLVNFRNYLRLGLRLSSGANLVLGANAQGKTNLVDALHILATGRSLRAGPEANWVYVDAPQSAAFARLAVEVEGRDGLTEIQMVVARTSPEAGADSGVRRRVRIGGVPRRLAELPGLLQVVSFSPLDLNMFTGPPAGRRRWLDLALAQLDRCYLEALTAYERILSRRNALLRRVRAQLAQPGELDFWDEQLATPATELVSRRRVYVGELGPVAGAEFDWMSGGAKLSVAYAPSIDTQDADEFRIALAKRRTRDIERNASGGGPHRDDLALMLDGRALVHFGSRGQVRLSALALKFAQFQIARARAGDAPVLLLDDIAAELDARHRRLLFERLAPDAQMIVTSADPSAVDAPRLRGASRFVVEAGIVRPIGEAA